MSNSKLVNYTRISPNSSNPRNDKIKKITIHHMAGDLSVETCGNVFAPKSRRASSNYGVDSNGRVGMYVEEKNRSWCSSSASNDNQAITIEVANNSGAPNWTVSDKALAKTIELCVDICKRNGIGKLNYTGDTSGNLTMHCWFAATACPGPYLKSKFKYIADEVNKRLAEDDGDIIYRVQVCACKVKSNAENQLKIAKDKGFSDAFIVEEILRADPPKKSVDEIAKEVLQGLWGVGQARADGLELAGYDYNEVQKRVNEIAQMS